MRPSVHPFHLARRVPAPETPPAHGSTDMAGGKSSSRRGQAVRTNEALEATAAARGASRRTHGVSTGAAAAPAVVPTAPSTRMVRRPPTQELREGAETQPLSIGLMMDAKHLREDIFRHLSYTLGRDSHSASMRYRYNATVLAIRDRLMERWKATHEAYYHADCKRGYYLSLEFLMGRALGNSLLNLGVTGETGEALKALGHRLEDVVEEEADAGLGN